MIMQYTSLLLSFTLAIGILSSDLSALAFSRQQRSLLPPTAHQGVVLSRRDALVAGAALVTATSSYATPVNAAKTPNGIQLTESSSGLKWSDVKVGTGQALTQNSPVSIDYSMASTAGRFPRIYTTKESGTPYRWTLGDGSTIAGIELGILGDASQDIPPMQPGGIRRLIVPANLGYQSLGKANAKCLAGEKGSIGPIPPKDGDGAYQRWYQFYCNPRIPYQPDLVLDIKLYGKR